MAIKIIFIFCARSQKKKQKTPKVFFSKSSETCVFPNLNKIEVLIIMSGDESYIFPPY